MKQKARTIAKMSEILVASIPSLLTLVGVIVTVAVNSSNTRKQIKEHTNLTIYRIEQLEKKQDRYNNLQERMFKNEEAITILKEQVKVANHRIEDLENDGK